MALRDLRATPRVAVALTGAVLVAFACTAQAERLVSVGGAVTEIVYALGAAGQLVARDSTSTYPPAVEALPDVGYLRRLSAEPVLALDPTMVLAGGDAGPKSAFDQLQAAGVRVVHIEAEQSIAGVQASMRAVGEALGRADQGEALARRFGADHARLAGELERYLDGTERPRVLFVLSVGSGRPALAAGRETGAASIIALAGGDNALDAFDGYKPLIAEAVIASAPDVILVTDRTVELLGDRNALLALPALAQTPAAEAGRVVTMNGLLLLGFGPRTVDAARALAKALHPEFGAD